jgi:hypothetical protein
VLGRWVSDLQAGDLLPPVEYVVTPFLIREYCHGVEEDSERFLGTGGARGQLAPPTLVHVDKVRVLDQACPKGPGPAARMHTEYDAVYYKPIVAGERLTVGGEVADRFERNGRERLVILFEVRDAVTGELHTRYRDTSVLSYQPKE